MCGAHRGCRLIGAQAQAFSQDRRHFLQAPNLVQHRAELLLEGHGCQTCVVSLQRLLAVLAHKVSRIRVARPDHPFVAVTHHIRVARCAIGHGDEIGQQAA